MTVQRKLVLTCDQPRCEELEATEKRATFAASPEARGFRGARVEASEQGWVSFPAGDGIRVDLCPGCAAAVAGVAIMGPDDPSEEDER